MSLVVHPSPCLERDAAGGKAWALSRLGQVSARIPPWFVIRPEAFVRSLDAGQRDALQQGRLTPDALRGVGPSDGLQRELAAAVAAICPDGAPVAVRSSAVEEDSAGASFAGQLESFLDVSHEDVPARVADVWRSAFTARVRAYRRANGLGGVPQPPAVLIQRMVRSEVSGVAFGVDPVTGDRGCCVICATTGLGDQLVSGQVQGDVYRVDRSGAITGRPENAAAGTLSPERVRAVARLATQAGALFDGPQDIEWAFADGALYLLQARPVTTLGDESLAGPVALWDNSNIVESYGGVTSPLTFSFARHVYAAVYRQFMTVSGVSRATLDRHAHVFRTMLGSVDGRVYYNLLNWYRMLAMLPGARANRRFLDLMLGVDRPLPRELLDEILRPPAGLLARGSRVLAALRALARIGVNGVLLRSRTARFHRRVDAPLSTPVADLAAMRLDQLAAHFRQMERDLLSHWEAPVVNDFFCMVWFGLSRGLLRRWVGPAGDALHGAFMQERGGIVSTEPTRRIRTMARIAAGDAALCSALLSAGRDGWRRAVATNQAFRAEFDAYLERFGDRCFQELKLESPTLYDDPSPLLQTVGHLAEHVVDAAPRVTRTDPRPELRRLMRRRPLRHLFARWLLALAARRVRDRENLRFERTRVFGRARRVFVRIGEQLAGAGVIAAAPDVFYLELDELLGTIDGTATTADLQRLVDVRRDDEARFRASPAPPNRFVTHGAVRTSPRVPLDDRMTDDSDDPEQVRSGLACSPGVARGKARVIDDPEGRTLAPGEILVAKQTDPGWVILFTSAAALVVERGSLLSHSAIVARELGIPAVVAVPGVTTWLEDGDDVEVDGTHGIVRRAPDGHAPR